MYPNRDHLIFKDVHWRKIRRIWIHFTLRFKSWSFEIWWSLFPKELLLLIIIAVLLGCAFLGLLFMFSAICFACWYDFLLKTGVFLWSSAWESDWENDCENIWDVAISMFWLKGVLFCLVAVFFLEIEDGPTEKFLTFFPWPGTFAVDVPRERVWVQKVVIPIFSWTLLQ